jgi:hypothetical protein
MRCRPSSSIASQPLSVRDEPRKAGREMPKPPTGRLLRLADRELEDVAATALGLDHPTEDARERHHRTVAGAHPPGAIGRRHGDHGHPLQRELGQPGERVVPLTVEVLTRRVGHGTSLRINETGPDEGELGLRASGSPA